MLRARLRLKSGTHTQVYLHINIRQPNTSIYVRYSHAMDEQFPSGQTLCNAMLKVLKHIISHTSLWYMHCSIIYAVYKQHCYRFIAGWHQVRRVTKRAINLWLHAGDGACDCLKVKVVRVVIGGARAVTLNHAWRDHVTGKRTLLMCHTGVAISLLKSS